MKTFILVANKDEANHLNQIAQENQNVQILIVGEGRSHVISDLANNLKNGTFTSNDRIINVGYVGANGLKKGSVVTIEKVQHLFPSKTINESEIVLSKPNCDTECIKCYTADNFVNKDDVDIKDACVIDMELYYIALIFPEVVSIKIVSDELNYNDYKVANFNESWEKVRNIIKKMI